MGWTQVIIITGAIGVITAANTWAMYKISKDIKEEK